MSKLDGGSAFPCSVCGGIATIMQGHQHLCDKHYRFGQMRANAKRNGKLVPTRNELSIMRGVELVCPDCGVKMNWRSIDGMNTVASLQHYRDGTMAIVCRACNTRHAFMPDDTYREMPKDQKLCPCCKQIKPLTEYSLDAGRSGVAKRKSHCHACSDKSVNEWRELNRERYNEYQRAYRAQRKAEGNPVRRCD